MQPGLMTGIVFAIVAALFAMRNVAPLTFTIGLRRFAGALAQRRKAELHKDRCAP